MRTLIFILLSSLTSTLALAGVKIEHWTAPTGARVYFIETRVIPILDVQIDFAAGGTSGMTVSGIVPRTPLAASVPGCVSPRQIVATTGR